MKLLILFCIFIAEVALSTAREKPGTCPAPPPIGTCDERCNGDDDCRGVQKCCSHGCGHSCQNPVSIDICSLPKVVGQCEAAMSSWWFNKATGRCEHFFYGGCHGNANRFSSKRACEKRCKDDTPVCKQPKKPGLCKAYMPRFYFNYVTGRCERFIYGGCGANDNNFLTIEDCRKKCGVVVPRCELEKKVGPCRAAIPRWYFNAAKGRCEKFSWGGCKPNANNFRTVDECIRACPERPSQPHAGQCPRVDFSFRPYRRCARPISGCRSDHHCTASEKCCEQLCYDYQCKLVVFPIVKLGRCPAVRSSRRRPARRCFSRKTCTQDSQCPGNQKCCQAPGPSRCKICQRPSFYRG